MAAIIFAFFGFVFGAVILLLWNGVALFFGLPHPTPEQIQGLLLVFSAGSFAAGLVLSAIFN